MLFLVRRAGNRKNPASFVCRKCGRSGNSDEPASLIIRNRGFYIVRRHCHGEQVYKEDALTGWRNQSSRDDASPG